MPERGNRSREVITGKRGVRITRVLGSPINSQRRATERKNSAKKSRKVEKQIAGSKSDPKNPPVKARDERVRLSKIIRKRK